jgi:hypothetical protein
MLAPSAAVVPSQFRQAEEDHLWHRRMLAHVQRMRGKVYLDDGAILESQLTIDGRHGHEADRASWHMLAVDDRMNVYGCSRYLEHRNSVKYSRLGVCGNPLATSGTWGARFRDAVETDLELARARGIAYVEVGGWALMPEVRLGMEALRIALATYSLARILGGCIGIATVTRRHDSSSILRRIGGRPLTAGGVDLPPYFDPQYGCEMEILRFDSSEPNPRYEAWIEELSEYLRTEPVIHAKHHEPSVVAIPVRPIARGTARDAAFQPDFATAV